MRVGEPGPQGGKPRPGIAAGYLTARDGRKIQMTYMETYILHRDAIRARYIFQVEAVQRGACRSSIVDFTAKIAASATRDICYTRYFNYSLISFYNDTLPNCKFKGPKHDRLQYSTR